VAERRNPLAADPCVHRDGGRADSPGRLLPSQALLGPHNRVRRPMTPRGRTRRSTRDALSKSRSAVLTFLPRSPRILIGGFRRSCSPEPS
jgi:hypothetical protein